MDYKEMYFKLFNKISDVIDDLTTVQKEVEEMYISSDEEDGEKE